MLAIEIEGFQCKLGLLHKPIWKNLPLLLPEKNVFSDKKNPNAPFII